MQFLPYLVAALVLAFVGLQMYPYFKLRATRGNTVPEPAINTQNPADSEAEQAGGRKLYYFMAPQCGMCRNITPIVDELAASRNDIVRIDAAESPETARAFNVMGTPAFVLVNDGVVEKVKLGGMTRQKILDMIDS